MRYYFKVDEDLMNKIIKVIDEYRDQGSFDTEDYRALVRLADKLESLERFDERNH